MSALPPTPGQTIGPFFGYSLPYAGGPELVSGSHPAAVRLHGVVRDGAGAAVPDAVLEIWQTAPDGTVVREPGSLRRDGWTFTGWGRAATDATGHYAFTTLAPGGDAPFFAVTLFARGLLDRLFTRAYLDDASPFLATVPADRRATLVADRDEHGYRFDVVLQGAGETVFLAHPGRRGR